MARSLRPNLPGFIHHVTSHAVAGEVFFRDDVDRRDFMVGLARAGRTAGWNLGAWCLMDTHLHLLIGDRLGKLATGMHSLLSSYVRRTNQRRGRKGALVDGRYHSELILTDDYLAAAARYIAMNPVEAKMVDRPEDFLWSSHRVLAGLEPPRSPGDEALFQYVPGGREAYLTWFAS